MKTILTVPADITKFTSQYPDLTSEKMQLVMHLFCTQFAKVQDGFSVSVSSEILKAVVSDYQKYVKAAEELGWIRMWVKRYTRPTLESTSPRIRALTKHGTPSMGKCRQWVASDMLVTTTIDATENQITALRRGYLVRKRYQEGSVADVAESLAPVHEWAKGVMMGTKIQITPALTDAQAALARDFNQNTERTYKQGTAKSRRTYHTVQNLPSDLRQYLTINGNRVAQVDIAKCHASVAMLLFHKAHADVLPSLEFCMRQLHASYGAVAAHATAEGIPTTEKDIKDFVNSTMNRKRFTGRATLKALYTQAGYEMVFRAFEYAHRLGVVRGGFWTVGEEYEVRLMTRMMEAAQSAGIPLISLHDAFEVAEKDLEEALAIFDHVCMDLVGLVLATKVTLSDGTVITRDVMPYSRRLPRWTKQTLVRGDTVVGTRFGLVCTSPSTHYVRSIPTEEDRERRKLMQRLRYGP